MVKVNSRSGERSNGPRCYIQNQKVSGSTPLSVQPGFGKQHRYDDTRTEISKRSDYHQAGKTAPSTKAQSRPWGSQIVDKKLLG